MAKANDWFPDDENEDRDFGKCHCCKKTYSWPVDFENEGYCKVCQADYEKVE